MAYAQDTILIKRVQTAASRMKVAARWASGRPVRVKDDFLFEMYLLFRLLAELSKSYDVEYVPGVGNKRHVFPRKPAMKQGRPKFHIKDRRTSKVRFQVCAGTKARDRHEKRRGLDLSLQSANASDDPRVGDILQILDAKYREDAKGRITHPEFSGFAHWVESFQLRSSKMPNLDFGNLLDLQANCLVTNGSVSTEEDGERRLVSVREVAKFYPGKKHHRRPR